MMVILFIAAYFATINLLAFALMGIDKRKAIKGAFRIPEATLFIIAVIGGSHHRRQYWFYCRYVYLPPQDKALQVCIWYAGYSVCSDTAADSAF